MSEIKVGDRCIVMHGRYRASQRKGDVVVIEQIWRGAMVYARDEIKGTVLSHSIADLEPIYYRSSLMRVLKEEE